MNAAAPFQHSRPDPITPEGVIETARCESPPEEVGLPGAARDEQVHAHGIHAPRRKVLPHGGVIPIPARGILLSETQ